MFGVDVSRLLFNHCVVLVLGAVQLISIGVLGEYLGRVSEEVKHRPVFVVSKIKGALSDKLEKGTVRTHNGLYVNDSKGK